MDSSTHRSTTLTRHLAFGGLWLLMINGMVGAGIFGIPAEAARLVGALSPLLFLVAALLMAPVMLCFAELASATRDTGGPARYVGIAFGPFAGFQAGWALYIARMTAFAANLNLLLGALAHYLPELADGLPRQVGLALLVLLFAWLNIAGVRSALASLGLLTLLKLGPLFLLLALGLPLLGDAATVPRLLPEQGDAIGAALLLTIYAFIGFESGLIPGGEARNPQRDMPRALLSSLLICGVLYALLQWVCLALLPGLAGSTRPLVELGGVLLGEFGIALLLVAVATSVGANLLGSMFSAPRITFGLAEQGLLPRWFGVVEPVRGTPANAVIAYALLSWLLAASGSFVWLAGLSVVTRLLIFLGCFAAMPAVRRQAPADALRLPALGLIAALAALVALGLLAQATAAAYAATAGLLAVGSVLYLIARRHRR